MRRWPDGRLANKRVKGTLETSKSYTALNKRPRQTAISKAAQSQKNQVCADTGNITLIHGGSQTPPALPQVCSSIRAPLKCLSSGYPLGLWRLLSLPPPSIDPSSPACMLPCLGRTSNSEPLETIPEELENL